MARNRSNSKVDMERGGKVPDIKAIPATIASVLSHALQGF
jgi:hypothetical protein